MKAFKILCTLSDICPNLSKDEATVNVNDFKDIGVKGHVLDALFYIKYMILFFTSCSYKIIVLLKLQYIYPVMV